MRNGWCQMQRPPFLTQTGVSSFGGVQRGCKVGKRRSGSPGVSEDTWSSSVVIFRSLFLCREWRVESIVGSDEVAEGGAVP